jgi:hypothetical protein
MRVAHAQDVRPTVSEGFLRYEYFLVWAELVALVHMAWSILSCGGRPVWIRASSLLLMSIVTAISITHTNAQMTELCVHASSTRALAMRETD